jgi:hypothetical protein
MWYRTTQLWIWIVPRRVRERIAAAYCAVHDRLYNMVDWDAITAPPNPLPGIGAPDSAASAGTRAAPPAASRTITRALSSALAEAPKRLLTAVVAATRNPPMTPFERKRTSVGLGSDVV